MTTGGLATVRVCKAALRTPELAAVLGVLRSGAAYLPLDEEHEKNIRTDERGRA